MELSRGAGGPGADARAERALASSARSNAGRRLPRGWRHLQIGDRRCLPTLRRLGTRARSSDDIQPRGPYVPLLRAPGAAHPREEGLLDDAVPLGIDVSRLPTARWIGR